MEKLNGQQSANKDDKYGFGVNNAQGEELIIRGKIIGTPFEMVTIEGKSFLAYGNYRVSDVTEDKEALRNLVENKEWQLMHHMATAIAHAIVTNAAIVEPQIEEIRNLKIERN